MSKDMSEVVNNIKDKADDVGIKPFSGKTFLVADDEPDIRELLKDEFEFEGATVFEAENGRAALEIVKSKNIDVVISDIRMPGGDGVTLATEVKKMRVDKPVTFLITGFADINPEDAYDIGVEGFITKPFNLKSIRQEIVRSLETREKRWLTPLTNPPLREVTIEGELQNLLSGFQLKVGRGGFFLSGDYSQFRVSDLVSFKFNHDHSGVGIVRWVRNESGDGKAPGIGVEFVNLKLPTLGMFSAWIMQNNPKSFIPRG